jgi:hypothetical protein
MQQESSEMIQYKNLVGTAMHEEVERLAKIESKRKIEALHLELAENAQFSPIGIEGTCHLIDGVRTKLMNDLVNTATSPIRADVYDTRYALLLAMHKDTASLPPPR